MAGRHRLPDSTWLLSVTPVGLLIVCLDRLDICYKDDFINWTYEWYPLFEIEIVSVYMIWHEHASYLVTPYPPTKALFLQQEIVVYIVVPYKVHVHDLLAAIKLELTYMYSFHFSSKR